MGGATRSSHTGLHGSKRKLRVLLTMWRER